MIIDCFPFFNELDILEIRLNILNDFVDKFILVEASNTQSKLDKPFYFEENKKRFDKFLDKIIHIKVTDYPDQNGWEMENYQRNCILKGLNNIELSTDDIIGISDVDEIWSPNCMDLVKSNIKLAVVSDAPAREAWLRLCHINFHHTFDVVVTYDDTKERKPSPVPFRTALEKLGIEPHEAIMVGDWVERDMVGAKNVGMHTAFAQYGDSFGNQNIVADYILSDISQLLQIVHNHNTL